jgi:hypothetical protein
VRRYLALFFLLVASFARAQTSGGSAFTVQPLTGLNVQVRGGTLNINGVPTPVSPANISLPANSTSYVFLTLAGTISSNQTGFQGAATPLATVVTGPNFVISIQDQRPDMPSGSSSVSPLAIKTVTASDNFQRANTVGTLGTSSSGLAWQPLTGNGASTSGINGNAFTMGAISGNVTVYGGLLSPTTVTRIAATFSWNGGSGTCGSMTLIGSADSTITLSHMLHLQFDCNGVSMLWWNGVLSSQNPQVTVGSTTYSSALATNGTVYTIAMTFVGNWCEVEKPDGTTVWYYDPQFSASYGNLAIFQLGDNSSGNFHPAINSVELDGPTSSIINGQLQANSGIQNTPIGSTGMAAGFFSGLGVGTQQPKAKVHVQSNGGDNTWFEAIGTASIVRSRASTAGNFAAFILDEGQAFAGLACIYSAGNSNDLRLGFGCNSPGDKIVMPAAGGVNLPNDTLRAKGAIADQGTACTNGELALSAGWQSTGTATATAVAGNGQTCQWTITTGTTTAANPTVTDTLTNALPAATTVCELNIHGGTHTAAAGEGFTQTTLSATAPVFTFIGTPTAGGTTYFVTRRCGP